MSTADRHPDDAALVAACRRGDPGAWEALILRYRRLVYSIPAAYRLERADADEIFQRVALKWFEHLPRLRDASALPAWLVVTTRRECTALLATRRRFTSIDEDGAPEPGVEPPDVVEEVAAVAREHALELAFERLGEPCRGLLTALYVEEPRPSYGEIGRRLGRPIGSLGPTRSRCLEKLRVLYLESGGEAP